MLSVTFRQLELIDGISVNICRLHYTTGGLNIQKSPHSFRSEEQKIFNDHTNSKALPFKISVFLPRISQLVHPWFLDQRPSILQSRAFEQIHTPNTLLVKNVTTTTVLTIFSFDWCPFHLFVASRVVQLFNLPICVSFGNYLVGIVKLNGQGISSLA